MNESQTAISDRVLFAPNDLVSLTSTALMQLSADEPELFAKLQQEWRTGGRIVAMTEDIVVLDMDFTDEDGQPAPVPIAWNPMFPHRTILPVSAADGSVTVPGQTTVQFNVSTNGHGNGNGAEPSEDQGRAPPMMALPQIPVVQQVAGAMPTPQFQPTMLPMFGHQPRDPNQPDLSRRLIPLRVQLAATFISQILTLRQSAIGYATSLMAEHGIAKAHQPKPEDEGWRGEEEEAQAAPRSVPTVQLTMAESKVYTNALTKLDTWMMEDDDDLPWKPLPQLHPPAADAALGSEPD